jgi:hypothetical protein
VGVDKHIIIFLNLSSTSIRGKDTLLCIKLSLLFQLHRQSLYSTCAIVLNSQSLQRYNKRGQLQNLYLSEKAESTMHVTFYLAAAAVLKVPSYHLKTTKTLLVLCRQSQDARRQALLLLLVWPEQCQTKHQRWEKSLERRFESIAALLADTSYNLSFHWCRRTE